MTENKYIEIIVPEEFNSEIESLLSLFNYSLIRSHSPTEQVFDFIKPHSKTIDGSIIIESIILCTTVSVGWFTTKWADEYLWPDLKEKIDEPSKASVKWLLSQLKKLNHSLGKEDSKDE